MKSQDLHHFNIGPRLTLAFTLLIALIVCGNGLVLWQFQLARLQTERLTGGNQQVITALELDRNLLLFYHRLDELVQSQNADRFVAEAEPLSRTLLKQIHQARNTLIHLPPKTRVDPAFLPTLDAIETDLPSQVESFSVLAKLGEWELVRTRLASGMRVLEAQISNLVASIDQQSSEELTNAVANMRNGERRIVFVVPVTAISTVFIAAFFGWAVTRRMLDLSMEERVGERTRLARELHDTLLQNFHGLMFQFQAARNLMLRKPDEAQRALDDAIDETKRALAASRDAIQGLRLEPMATGSLAELLKSTSRELATVHAPENPPVFDLIEEGARQTLSANVSNEICRIALELMRNSYQHAHAQRIEVEIRYDDSMFRLRIRDDGKGIDPAVLKEGGRSGHWGLRGVRERADRIGARLDLWSEPGGGTEVQLVVPASIAYENFRVSYRAKLVRKVKSHAGRL